MTVGFLYGPGAETLIFVTGTSGKYPKIFVSQQKNQSQLWIPGKLTKIGVWVSGAEIQTSAVDTRTAVWVSTTEKISKIFLGETRIFLESLPSERKNLHFKFAQIKKSVSVSLERIASKQIRKCKCKFGGCQLGVT